MNRTSLFPALAFGGGALAYILRLMQNRTGFEFPSGLPVAGNLWAILLPVVLAVILAASLVLNFQLAIRASAFVPPGKRILTIDE